MTTYIISLKTYSPRAAKYYGRSPYVWIGNWKWKGRFPTSKIEIHALLYRILLSHGHPEGGTVKVVRPQAEGESPGFKEVFYGLVTPENIQIERIHERASGDIHKANPNLPWSRQPYYQREYGRFSGFRKSRGRGRF